MKQQDIAEAIRLREEGRIRQDQVMLEVAKFLLLGLSDKYPDDAEIAFQTAAAHDNLGLEREAIPFYVKALELAQDLSESDHARAYLGLGSTYRGLGEYRQAEETLRQGVSEFPDNHALKAFLAITLYNMQQYKEAMELMLTNLIETTSDKQLQYYKQPLLYYAAHLDEIW